MAHITFLHERLYYQGDEVERSDSDPSSLNYNLSPEGMYSMEVLNYTGMMHLLVESRHYRHRRPFFFFFFLQGEVFAKENPSQDLKVILMT